MPRKQFSSEQIITKQREAEALLSQGLTVIEVVKKLEISEQIYIECTAKKLVAVFSVDNTILKEVLLKKS